MLSMAQKSQSLELSQGAVLAIALIILLLITTNLGLWAIWKWRSQAHNVKWMDRISEIVRSQSNNGKMMQKFGETLRNPWDKEDKQISELAQIVKELTQKGKNGNNDTEDK